MLARCILARLPFPSARFNVLKLNPAPGHALETEAGHRITAFRYRFAKNTLHSHYVLSPRFVCSPIPIITRSSLAYLRAFTISLWIIFQSFEGSKILFFILAGFDGFFWNEQGDLEISRFSSIIWINGKVFKDCSKIQEFLFPLY